LRRDRAASTAADLRARGRFGEKGWRPQTEVFAGLSLGLGGKPSDKDVDGVPDRDDACPGTPAGARVDLKGCPVDGDKDGVPDGIDKCEPTPPGAKVDASGCPTDTDGDGVFDGIDTCADTPAHVVVDAAGCPLDSDQDGVFDGLDQCASTPKGCTVDASGCPTDTDKDGVCDGLDQCADTPSDVRTDANGCPITVMETELLETGMIRLHEVNFQSGKAKLQPESYPLLDQVGDILSRWPELHIEIGGHTDSQGSVAFNQKLSEDRAKAVAIYLVTKFPNLQGAQLTSAGYGESKPIAPNDTANNREKNRRVEFKVLNTEAEGEGRAEELGHCGPPRGRGPVSIGRLHMARHQGPVALVATALLLTTAAAAAPTRVTTMRLVAETDVAAAPDAVWGWITNGKNLVTWCPVWKSGENAKVHITKIGDVLDFSDEWGNGGRSIVTFVNKDKELRVAHEPDNGSYMCQSKFLVAATPTGAHVTWVEQYTEEQPPAIADKNASDMELQMSATLQALKGGVEGAKK
jgi:outer membrane protein OmpA-like peptidoglycan-associated protein